MRIEAVLILALTLFNTGCFTPQKEEIPQWVESPPAATASHFYGVSVSDTPADAILSAAGGIASGILDNATPKIKELDSRQETQRRIRSAAKALLRDLDYSEVTPKEQVNLNDQTAVLVTLNRNTVRLQLASVLKHDTEVLKASVQHATDAPAFSKLGALGKAYETLPKFLAEIALNETVNPSADTTSERQLAKQIEHAYSADKFGAGISVISDAEGIVFVNVLYTSLRSQGIVSSGKKTGSILVSANSLQAYRDGKYDVTYRVRFKCSSNGKDIAKSEHFLKASSSTGYSEAKKRTAEALSLLIDEKGIFHILGF